MLELCWNHLLHSLSFSLLESYINKISHGFSCHFYWMSLLVLMWVFLLVFMGHYCVRSAHNSLFFFSVGWTTLFNPLLKPWLPGSDWCMAHSLNIPLDLYFYPWFLIQHFNPLQRKTLMFAFLWAVMLCPTGTSHARAPESFAKTIHSAFWRSSKPCFMQRTKSPEGLVFCLPVCIVLHRANCQDLSLHS